MTPQRIGIVHPGSMGISIAASAQNSGHHVSWASEGRSGATVERATKHGLRDAGSLARLCAECTVLISVCPPHAAEPVARQVAAQGFRGLYVDANAIAPRRVVCIGRMLVDAGAAFVDGGIIGEPAWEPGRTWLYLAGPRADEVTGLFAAGPLGTHVLGATVGQASALKMCFAAYTKGTTALLCAILAAAEQLHVRDALERQWAHGDAAFTEQAHRRVRGVTAKAWRFVGEMDEIAATFRDAGVPGEFHEAAATIYRRLTDFKESRSAPALEDVLAALTQSGPAARV
jgi:3-hydroxyisobutyrate dehydrogenase-like beta-hydroxyacid dehydrogenase